MQASQEICIATAIFPTLSLLNHSCSPNTSLVFSTGAIADPSGSDLCADLGESVSEERSSACGVTVTVRAAKVITPGEEILHCYGKKTCHLDIFHKTEGCIQFFFFYITPMKLMSHDFQFAVLFYYYPLLRSPQQTDGDPRTAASPAGTILLPVSVWGLQSADAAGGGGGGGCRGQRAVVRSTWVWSPVWKVQRVP